MYEFPALPQSMRKDIRSLHKRAQRDSRRLFIVEGEKLAGEALTSGLRIHTMVIHPEASATAVALAVQCADSGIAVFQTPRQHFESLCDTSSPQSILAVAEYPAAEIDYSRPLIILDGVADPGNVGTIIRTAEWFGYRGVVLGPGCADRFNPKTLRSTMGSAFRVAIVSSNSLVEDIQRHLADSVLYGAVLDATTALADIRPDKRHAVVLGSESHGISAEVRSLLTQEFFIPGGGRTESLNVAVAAGVALYHFSMGMRKIG